MGIQSLDHVQLAMPPGGEDQARSFYAGLLGLAEVKKPLNLLARGGCWFQSGGAKVHLGVEADFRPARKAHPAFLVDDLLGMSKAVSAAGYEVAQGEPLEGCQRIYVFDPFGNRIELMHISETEGTPPCP